jgi:hypothetical protein
MCNTHHILAITVLLCFGTNSHIALAQRSSAEQQVETPFKSSSELTVYKTYQEAISASGNRLISINQNSRIYSGYSILPFGNRNKAVAEAMRNAGKSHDLSFLVFTDKMQFFPGEAPPPGSFIGGDYYVYRILSFQYIELTTENLMNEIKIHTIHPIGDISREHIKALVDIAKDPAFSSLTSEYKTIIRNNNNENFDGFALPGLIELIQFHEGKSCVDDLLRWAKFHKNPQARLGAYNALIRLGKFSEVEEILKSEENNSIKDAVKRSLI